MSNKPLVIVVEDDRDMREAISDIFEFALDVDVELIADGLMALERFQAVTPQLVLLDLHLPKVSGIDLLNRFVTKWRSSGTKIIAMTADLLLISKVETVADYCLSKPFSVEKLATTARQLLDDPSESTPD